MMDPTTITVQPPDRWCAYCRFDLEHFALWSFCPRCRFARSPPIRSIQQLSALGSWEPLKSEVDNHSFLPPSYYLPQSFGMHPLHDPAWTIRASGAHPWPSDPISVLKSIHGYSSMTPMEYLASVAYPEKVTIITPRSTNTTTNTTTVNQIMNTNTNTTTANKASNMTQTRPTADEVIPPASGTGKRKRPREKPRRGPGLAVSECSSENTSTFPLS